MSDEHAWKSKSRFFFCVGENKYPRMFIVHVWNIFFGFFFFCKRKKNPRMSQDIGGFFLSNLKNW